jgi:hypothetical protein
VSPVFRAGGRFCPPFGGPDRRCPPFDYALGVRVCVPLSVLAAVLLLVAAGCGDERAASPEPARRVALLPDGFIRSPQAKTDMDTNPANLASAVVTYNFGQLPRYIDAAEFRLLPHDLAQTSEPGRTLRHVYRITVPRTRLVLNTAVTTAPALQEAKSLARNFRISVSLDGRYVRQPNRYWVFYRNNGPQICRIYFPGDLGSLNMGANSMVFHPLSAGRHRLRVELVHELTADLKPARLVSDYELRVLPRGPTAAERAISPDEEGPPPPTNRTPLTFRGDHPELLTRGH